VLIDGKARYACMTLAVEADGTKMHHGEGPDERRRLGPTQQAFAEEDAFQVATAAGPGDGRQGFCARPVAELDQIPAGHGGNICRCGTYAHIFNGGEGRRPERQGR